MRPFIRMLRLLVLIAGSGLPLGHAEMRSEDYLATAQESFRRGAYSRAIESASQVSRSSSVHPTALYVLGVSYARLQSFAKASEYFRRALEGGCREESLNYEYGQALLASRKLTEAAAQFELSSARGFRSDASTYYLAYIQQLMGNDEGALVLYERLQSLPDADGKLKQPALYQIAEIANKRSELEKDENQRRLRLRESVIPLYERARDFAEATPTADQAGRRVTELQRLVAVEPGRMRNGIPLPIQPYTLRIAQTIGLDSNVTTQANGATISVSRKRSPVLKSSLLGRYQWNWREAFSLLPELTTAYTYYTERKAPSIFQNDNISLSPALRTKYEHWVGGRAASFLFDVDFNLTLRDYRQAHKLPHYSRHWTYTLGERLQLWEVGTTTVRGSVKFYEYYDTQRSSITGTLSLQQNVNFRSLGDLVNIMSMDFVRARNDYYDERNYKLYQSAPMTGVLPKTVITPSYSLAVKDTMKQKGSRGNELNFNPGVAIERELPNLWTVSGTYSFTRNLSKSKESYEYSRHEVNTGLAKNF